MERKAEDDMAALVLEAGGPRLVIGGLHAHHQDHAARDAATLDLGLEPFPLVGAPGGTQIASDMMTSSRPERLTLARNCSVSGCVGSSCSSMKMLSGLELGQQIDDVAFELVVEALGPMLEPLDATAVRHPWA